MADAEHAVDALVESGVAEADGRVAVVEQLVDGLSRLQACVCSVLPEDGCDVGRGAEQLFVTELQSAVAELQALVEHRPDRLEHLLCGRNRRPGCRCHQAGADPGGRA